MRVPNLHTLWAELLVDGLAAAGVREAVICPGSRSAPLALAAARHPRMRARSMIDERSAAFYALGQARVTNRPSLVLCTSGTAGAHAYPAVIEASQAGIPMVVVTADRPPELQQRGANQTVDQAHLFGGFVRLFLDVGTPDPDPRALRGVRAAGGRAAAAAQNPPGGPVHINAPFRKPIEPEDAADETVAALARKILEEPTPAVAATRSAVDPRTVELLADACRGKSRGFIVCGPLPLRDTVARAHVAEVARRTGYPLLAEATSQCRFCRETEDLATCDAFDVLFRSPLLREELLPDIVIRVGEFPVSKGLELLAETTPPGIQWIVADAPWADPANDAAGFLHGNVAWTLRALADLLPEKPGEPTLAWSQRCAEANRAAWDAVDACLETPEDGLPEPWAVRRIVETLPPDSILMLGNSLPVREVDWVAPARSTRADVLSQRGASGIDGVVSAAVGSATVAGRPVTLLTGDLGFLHDVQGLLPAFELEHPLTIVVLNNRGGRIFEQLPIARDPSLGEELRRFFVAEYLMDFHGIAKSFGIDYERVAHPDDLGDALRTAHAANTSSILEIGVGPSSAAAFMERLTRRMESVGGGV